MVNRQIKLSRPPSGWHKRIIGLFKTSQNVSFDTFQSESLIKLVCEEKHLVHIFLCFMNWEVFLKISVKMVFLKISQN